MPRLTLPAADFFGERPRSIRRLVHGLAALAKRLQIRPQKHSLGQIIAVSDSYGAKDPPTERLFRTISDSLYGQYYEIWCPNSAATSYHLHQNYFHLYSLPSRTERDQLVCLHSEPEEPFQPMASRVKCGPHIHVNAKEPRLLPIAKAHLPVCYSDTENVLGTLRSFDERFQEALDVIRHEIVDRYS